MDGWVGVDSVAGPTVDIVADLCARLPFDDDSVDEMLLSHVLEHLQDPLRVMQELHRIAKAGGSLVVKVPYGTSDDAWTDPTHIRPYFLGSWAYFAAPIYWRADYGYRGDWKTEDVILTISDRFKGRSPDEIVTALDMERNVCIEMIAVMTAVKPARPPRAGLHINPKVHLRFA